MQDLGALRARLLLESQQFKAGMQDARNQMKQTGWSAQQLGNDFGIVQRASLAVGAAIAAGLGASVTVAAQFEQSMAKVKAISGASAEEFVALEKAARDAGATTVFSASQAADALSYLAMAGFKVNDQVAALPSVLNAAAAGQIDLAKSADIVSNIMTGFGISAQDTGKAVDILVKTMTSANTDLPMLGDAMKYVAPVASSLGLGIEETAAAIAKMSDAGIQGSQAGTSLRAALLSLANPTGQTEDAMKNLGIKVTDANGKMKPLPELMGHIAESMEGLTDAQKTQAAAQLVGTEAASGFLAIMKVGEQGLKDFTNQLKNSGGTAERIAKVQNDTLIGSFKEFQSALEEAGIKLGKEFLPLFTEFVRKGTEVVRFLTELDSSTIKSGLAFAGTAAAVALTVSTIGKLVIAARGLMLTMGPAGWLITGISLLAGAVMGAKVSYEELNEVNLEHLDTLIKSKNELDTTLQQYEDLRAKSKLTVDEFARWVDIQSELNKTADPAVIAALKDEAAALQEKSGLSNIELDKMVQLNNDLIEKVPQATQKITDQGNAILENTQKVKELSQAKYEEIKIEAERQRTNLESKLADLLQKEKDLILEIKARKEEIVEADAEQGRLVRERRDLYLELQQAESEGNKALADDLKYKLFLLDEDIRAQKKIVDGIDKEIKKKDESLKKTQNELGKLDEIHWKLIEIELKRAGINGVKQEGLAQLDLEITKLQSQRDAMDQIIPKDRAHKEEHEKAKKALDEQLGRLITARDNINTNIQRARELNNVYGAPISKTVTINERTVLQTPVRAVQPGRGNIGTRHTGGRAGDALPELHTGGSAAQFISPPMHNEVDVRLLENEWVFTEAQMANLWKMIDAGFTPKREGEQQAPQMIQPLINITVEGNIDQDLYDEIMRQQYEDIQMKSVIKGVKGL